MDCRNCKTITVPESSFCNNCGEKIPFKRLTIKTLIATAFSQFFDLDNKVLRTFRKLFTNPEIVIDDYIKGFRKKYVNVISYLGLAITLIGLHFFILKKFYPELLSIDTSAAEKASFDIQKGLDTLYDYQGLLTILLLPLYALVSRLMFIDSKKYNVVEHFVINTYTTAQIFIVWFFVTMLVVPFGINYNLFSQVVSLVMLIYMVFVFKRLYPFSLGSIIFRTIAYMLLTFFIMMVIMLILVLIYGIYMGVTGQIPVKTV